MLLELERHGGRGLLVRKAQRRLKMQSLVTLTALKPGCTWPDVKNNRLDLPACRAAEGSVWAKAMSKYQRVAQAGRRLCGLHVP
ncbi:hypothetical protein SKAU_G00045530 [Synaphobranchus kaupii]|uniref:Uncharacterized protein n=1 Tax=Synaphobranchus kaupii TaxID=118154 RepID=A0A9Q1G1Y1_SYNKA|nr:hypothetical protein SKAU_G00045530 [Synaphobranchus kaupii]